MLMQVALSSYFLQSDCRLQPTVHNPQIQLNSSPHALELAHALSQFELVSAASVRFDSRQASKAVATKTINNKPFILSIVFTPVDAL